MLTLFTTAKPFRGHSGIIQRNALKSWTLLHPDVEIILFGDDEGGAEVCAEFGIRHEPHVERSEFGMIRIDSMFGRAEGLARHSVLCYLNCDIILMADFCSALEHIKAKFPSFLMVGRRWDTDISDPIDFSSPRCAEEIRARALGANHQKDEWWVDYFAFSRGLFGPDFPPFVVGRPCWDNYTVWRALKSGHPVVDASAVVLAVHQNHDYAQHPQGREGIWSSEDAQRNFELAGGSDHLRNIADANWVLRPNGLKSNRMRHWIAFKRATGLLGRSFRFRLWNPVWFFFLGVTRPIRSALGLRSTAMRRSRRKV